MNDDLDLLHWDGVQICFSLKLAHTTSNQPLITDPPFDGDARNQLCATPMTKQ
jgi:hypothetical protein